MTAIPQTTVNGRVVQPNDANPVSGVVRFTLSERDNNTAADAVVLNTPIDAQIDENTGDISVSLFPNGQGGYGTHYDVTATVYVGGVATNITLGEIVVPDSGPVDLNDLLPIPTPDEPTTAEYIAQLVASQAAAAASATAAESARDASQAARDTAEGHKIAAEAAATSATSTAAALTGLDLDAIAETKAVTAVDVFVYDTSKDSDGGAWRKRTQHTSWYNETLNTATRGSRSEFPAVAVIVAESDKVTIYDGDDPSLPMWMVFDASQSKTLAFPNGSSVNVSVYMLNGVLVIGNRENATEMGTAVVRFIADDAVRSNITSGFGGVGGYPISGRNNGGYWTGTPPYLLVNYAVNDVAMTVLPDAPIDPATGVPVPTIAVATDGGVSVIKDDGTVVDSADTYAVNAVNFDANNFIWYPRDGGSTQRYSQTYDTDGFTGRNWQDSTFFPRAFLSSSSITLASATDDHVVLGAINTNQGISRLAVDSATEGNSMVAYVTSSYNSGYQNGDIKGAFLSDTDDTDLVGATFADDFSAFADQAAMQSAGYSFSNSAFDAALDAVVFSGLASGSVTLASATLTAAGIADAYEVTTVVSGVTAGSISVQDNFVPIGSFSTNGVHVFRGTRGGNFRFVTANSFDGEIESITFRKIDRDRSVNNNGLIVNGTVTRTPVATGADLVAYSGFSTSNYLEQPYNSDLDFGTGDFCVMGWVKTSDSSGTIFDREAGSGSRFTIDIQNGNFRYRIGGSTVVSSSASSYDTDTWAFFTLVRKSGTAYVYVNGNLEGSAVDTTDYTNLSGVFRIGLSTIDDGNLSGSLALFRISATAPTAEQIAKIYEDEKFLFQEGAQATLYGASDAVTALAHDPVTDLLHVGTSAGRSVFSGLRRVSNTTTAVGTAISASNGLVVEE